MGKKKREMEGKREIERSKKKEKELEGGRNRQRRSERGYMRCDRENKRETVRGTKTEKDRVEEG